MIEFTLNGRTVRTDEDPDTPLLWVVRDTFGLKGSKYGCGAALCGACTMHVDGAATRTCVLPVSAVAGRSITTIEGAQRVPMRLLPVRADHVGSSSAGVHPNA
jgi:isoquinoline 1-oxidoreductase alpha subunit